MSLIITSPIKLNKSLPSLNLNWKYTDDINLDFNYYRSYNDLDNETAEYRVIRRNDIVSNNVGTFTDSNDNTYTGFITVTDSYEDIDKVNFDLEVYDNIDVIFPSYHYIYHFHQVD